MSALSIKEIRSKILGRLADSCTLGNADAKKLNKFLDGIFGKWVFIAIRNGIIDGNSLCILPGYSEDDLIQMVDLQYFEKTYDARFDIKTGTSVNRRARDFPYYDTRSKIPRRKLEERFAFDDAALRARICMRVEEFYNSLGGVGNFMSIPPKIVERYFTIELFGSPWNTIQGGRYCSALEIERTYFGSLGDAFDYNFQEKEFAIVNPPFDESMCIEAVARVVEQIRKVPTARAMIVVPDWEDMCDEKIAPLLPEGTIVRRLERNIYKFYDYTKFVYCPTVGTRAFFLGADIPINEILEQWRELSK